MTGRCPREAALSIRYRYLPTTLTATSSKGIQLPSKCRLMAVPHRSVQVPLPTATVLSRLGAGATRSVSDAPAASAQVFWAPYRSVLSAQ
eukprot:CAMPEP_0206145212 /NCGR_PEP_ID=MMETSP1473-20131121/26676_1 /ASSEMBLY_ACC=CAM_ASM_001109 /TAXON_ID=1461547 /ORGANISM="Stichococcus sp, Strain RCC1054" /LENGTH=89 /DNA_ID=CAMNT_0053541333 /DNA_START=29 /DNA_END=298 /DNA_ORIENTATION=+